MVLGLAGWAPAGAGAFPASIELSSLDGTNGFRITGAAPGDRSGFAVSGAGDVNGDGIADLLIGAYGADPNGNRSGASHVVFGRAPPASFPANLDLSTLNVACAPRAPVAEEGADEEVRDAIAVHVPGAAHPMACFIVVVRDAKAVHAVERGQLQAPGKAPRSPSSSRC